MSTGKELRRLRGKKSQQQMAFELGGISREGVSHYENERNKIPPDISSRAMERFDDPDYARAVASEYTAGAWAPALNGPALIRQCSAIQSRALKETEEAYEAMQKAVLDVNPQFLGNFERDDIKRSLDEATEAVAWLNEYMATVCRTYKFSWLKLWAGCQVRLIQRGFLRMVSKKV
ncbi:helix-turn-helix domain-containing protein [Sporolactobacillus pectinivorans]|uniref:helix-turn-helix domain-containing protein n=1 Tax=Sporolactobacillus pectinivorans TaxID=1591408 RepID=UPI000C269920|nr:helix-turn-helix domain-containing protein [Sporolactobacillus pectinivorans]